MILLIQLGRDEFSLKIIAGDSSLDELVTETIIFFRLTLIKDFMLVEIRYQIMKY